jgi:predicted GIY-YIG superfamily endonuclease
MADHALYRFFGQGGQLLYIGITRDPSSRWGQHRGDKPWWFEVQRIEIESLPDRASALKAERLAIQSEKPRYNVVHNRRTSAAPRIEVHQPLERDQLYELLSQELAELQAERRLARAVNQAVIE